MLQVQLIQNREAVYTNTVVAFFSGGKRVFMPKVGEHEEKRRVMK